MGSESPRAALSTPSPERAEGATAGEVEEDRRQADEAQALEPFLRLAREVINPANGERPWHADSQDWMVVFSFAGQSLTLGDLRRAAALSQPSQVGKEEADALRAEVLTIFKANKMASDERLAILIAERLAPRLNTPAPAAEPVAWAYEYTNHLKGDRAPGGWLRAVAFEPPTRARIEGGFARNIRALYASPDAILAKLSPGEEGWRPTHRHVKRGTTYQVVSEGLLQTAVSPGAWDDQPLTIYRGEDGRWWARPTYEFNDGRFEPLPPPPSSQEEDAGRAALSQEDGR